MLFGKKHLSFHVFDYAITLACKMSPLLFLSIVRAQEVVLAPLFLLCYHLFLLSSMMAQVTSDHSLHWTPMHFQQNPLFDNNPIHIMYWNTLPYCLKQSRQLKNFNFPLFLYFLSYYMLQFLKSSFLVYDLFLLLEDRVIQYKPLCNYQAHTQTCSINIRQKEHICWTIKGV